MKNSTIIIIGALIACAILFVRRSNKANAATLVNVLSGSQVTLGNGNVYDTGNGIVFDPMTGHYTNIKTGKIVY